jgi:DNA-binding phage protein
MVAEIPIKDAKVAHPLLRELLVFQAIDGRSMGAISSKAGYAVTALSRIRHDGHNPSLVKVAELGEVLGYRLAWVPLSSSSVDTGRSADNPSQ